MTFGIMTGNHLCVHLSRIQAPDPCNLVVFLSLALQKRFSFGEGLLSFKLYMSPKVRVARAKE